MPGNWGLIDLDTPQSAYTRNSFQNPGDVWDLVFSDEFNTDGRTFYPGDDPYWEAADLHYWQTVSVDLSVFWWGVEGLMCCVERFGVV
jgi:beta-glucan synthesis-associated protein KRE6